MAASFDRGIPLQTAVLLSAQELWHVLWPGHYVVTQIRVERIAPWLWDPMLTTVLAAPAWALFGVPGMALAWFNRPDRHMTEDEREDLEKQRQTLFLFDELADDARRQAREDGHDLHEDDTSPSHDGHDALEAGEDMPPQVDEDFLRQYLLDLEPGERPRTMPRDDDGDPPTPPEPANDRE